MRYTGVPMRYAIAVLVLCCAFLPTAACALAPADLPACPAKRQNCIALDLWLTSDFIDTSWLETQLEVANDKLATVDAGVQVVAVHTLPTELAQTDTLRQRNQLGRLGAQTPLRWFVVRHLADAEDPSAVRKGVTWRNGEAFWVIGSQTGMRWVLAHELGHVLGLPHSKEAASLMNKSPRVWPPPWQIGFTPREQPVMRRTLARLVQQKRLRLVGPE